MQTKTELEKVLDFEGAEVMVDDIPYELVRVHRGGGCRLRPEKIWQKLYFRLGSVGLGDQSECRKCVSVVSRSCDGAKTSHLATQVYELTYERNQHPDSLINNAEQWAELTL